MIVSRFCCISCSRQIAGVFSDRGVRVYHLLAKTVPIIGGNVFFIFIEACYVR